MDDERIEIKLLPAPDEKTESPEYQQALRDLVQSVRANGLKPSVGMRAMDAAGGVSPAVYNGGVRLAILTLAPIAIVQLRKLIEAFLKMRAGRKLKLRLGNMTIEGHAEDVEKLVTAEQIAKMLNAAKKLPTKISHG
jgi:hypothetical protein